MELWIRIKQMGFILKIERSVKSSRLLGNDIQTILGAKALGLHLWWGGVGVGRLGAHLMHVLVPF